MSRSRILQYKQNSLTKTFGLGLAFLVILLTAGAGYSQANPSTSTSTFRSGQSMYIVAFRRFHFQASQPGPLRGRQHRGHQGHGVNATA